MTASYIAILLFFCLLSHQVRADGVFEVEVLKFINNEGLDQLGRCCADPEATVCTAPCLTFFRICLTHHQKDLDPSCLGECSYASITSPVLGKNSFEPAKQRRLFQFNFTSSRWPRYFTLVIDAMGKVNREADEKFNFKPEEVLLSRAVTTRQLNPATHTKNSWITPDPYVHRDSILSYAYRMVCFKHYYGEDCSTYCQPRDDPLGHYRCDEMGNKVCLPGWTSKGPDVYCRTALCDSYCSGHGECVKPNTCNCAFGWTGKDCSQCIVLPGCDKGFCLKPMQCKCKTGWGGRFCNQDLNYCIHNHPCQNGGTCSNTGHGGYTCTCPAGYTGVNCTVEVNECKSNPCQNNGTCVDMVGSYHCFCSANYFGTNCKKISSKCLQNPCHNGGTCLSNGHHYSCQCPAGWTGRDCNDLAKSCSSNMCRNGGLCQASPFGDFCLCKTGFVGKYCQNVIRHCADLVCLNGGVCSNPNYGFQSCGCNKCKCPDPFTGLKCERSEELMVLPNSTLILKKHSNVLVISEKSLNTSQWIGICFASGVLVVLLIITSTCLVRYRRRSSTGMKPQSNLLRTMESCSNKKDSILVVTDFPECSALQKDDCMSSEIACWESRSLSENIDHETDCLNYSSTHSSAKNIGVKGQSSRPLSQQLTTRIDVSHRRTEENELTFSQSELPHNRSRLPTYEEVCHESVSTFQRVPFAESTNFRENPSTSSC